MASVDAYGKKDEMYRLLWHKCAGPLASVPLIGERVLYFPQGHIEQVEPYTHHDGKMEMPIYNLPNKILCKVVNVELKVDAQTDEVFTQVTLLPESRQEVILKDETTPSSPGRTKVYSFRKILTQSDTNTHGGFSIPKQSALNCFPPLDMDKELPTQEFDVEDLHGYLWQFRHTFRGMPKRHLLTSGWSTFVSTKKLTAGDAIIFLRGENGELYVGVCRAMKQKMNASPSIISGNTMQHGILASASHAFSVRTLFHVYYHPWTSPSEFIIPLDQYIKSAEHVYPIGTRFRMKFEDEKYEEKSFTGTVVGFQDIDGIRWPGSEWRCFKVQWDNPSDTILLPERVSPWSIQIIEHTNNKQTTSVPRKKWKFETDSSSSMPQFSDSARYGFFQRVVPYTPQRHKMVLQGQENQQNPFDQHSSSTKPFPSRNINVNSRYSGSQECNASELRHEIDTPLPRPNDRGMFRIFGVDFFKTQLELPSLQVANCTDNLRPCSVPPTSQSSVSKVILVPEPSKSISGVLSEKQCKKYFSVTNRCIKVHKYGAVLGRSIDLTRFHSCDELIVELDDMFDFKGSLINNSSGWHVTYTDDDGDIMLIGDNPWQKFCFKVQRMFIYPKEEIERLNPSSPNPRSP